MDIVARLLLLGFIATIGSALCPNKEDLAPNCWCMDPTSDAGTLFCQNLFSPVELLGPVGACADYKMYSIVIQNSTLRYLPHDIFKGTTFEVLHLMHTQLMSLSDGDVAFEGLEDHLREIRAKDTPYVAQWQFSQLRNLKKLILIDIHLIHMGGLAEDMPEFPELTAIGLATTGLSYIGDYGFSKCPKLSLLDLHDNELTQLKRTMLPNPAMRLSLINLDNNQLASLPKDFTEGMPSIHTIYLRNNKFSTLEENPFSSLLRNANELQMAGNPISCDCRLKWIVYHRSPYLFTAYCAKPASLRGYEVNHLKPQSIEC